MTDSGQLRGTDVVLPASTPASTSPIAPHVSVRSGTRARPMPGGCDVSESTGLGRVVRSLCKYRGAIATASFWLAALAVAALS
jgi:hypothetical protein